MIDEEHIHEILTRIHDGELIGRGEGKTSALLHFATDILTSHHNITINYIHQGHADHYVNLFSKIAETFFGIDDMRYITGTDKKTFNIGNSTIQFRKYNSARGLSDGRNSINIYDIPNTEREPTVIKIWDLNENYQYGWLNPTIEPNYEKYLPYRKKPSMNMQSAMDKWGYVNV